MNCLLSKLLWFVNFGVGIIILGSIFIHQEKSDNQNGTSKYQISKYLLKKQSPLGLDKSKKKKIVFFTKTWNKDGIFPYLKEANIHCPSCLFTQEPALSEKSDAIVIHGSGTLFYELPLPKRSSLEQLWILTLFESPAYVSYFPQAYDNVFNWTMTYRQDSDVFMPYGHFVKNADFRRPQMAEISAFVRGTKGAQTYENYQYTLSPSLKGFNKRGTAAWIVSNCQSLSQRERLTSALSKHIQLDIYGHCGNQTKNKCEDWKGTIPLIGGGSGLECRLQIHQKYKFYLAFENSLCQDYITEKAFDILLTEMIPVVYGGGDYLNSFPPKSFINVKDFGNMEELAKYLNYLAGNPLKWLEYFKWRKEAWVSTSMFVSGYCKLCNALWKKEPGTKFVYKSIRNWWNNGNSSQGIMDKSTYVCMDTVSIVSQLLDKP